MFDIFTKSKVESSPEPALRCAGASFVDDAWHIAHAIDRALKMAESERKSLADRIRNATAWSAVSLGNGNDEYVERESLDTLHLNRFDDQIRLGNQQSMRLDQIIACYKLLKTNIIAGFPELTKSV